jgi:RHS repeat-associated protein
MQYESIHRSRRAFAHVPWSLSHPKAYLWLMIASISMVMSPEALGGIGDATPEDSVGPGPSVISVNTFAGAASSSYTFHVPPGRSGVELKLQIVYSSGAAHATPIGRGWDFTFPYIQRSLRAGQPAFSWTDKFAISWNGRLMDLMMRCDPCEGSPPGVREFRTEIETFMRIKSYSFPPSLTYWEVEDGSGRIYQFGADAAGGSASAQVGDFKWALNRIKDSHGNYLTIEWLISSGHMYPKQILYTGNLITAAVPTNRVEFGYEGRPDRPDSFLGVPNGAGKSELLYRLRRVKTWAGVQVASVYLLNYTTASTGEHPIDLCAGTTCTPTTSTCGSGYTGCCSNSCDANTGFCSACEPVCPSSCGGGGGSGGGGGGGGVGGGGGGKPRPNSAEVAASSFGSADGPSLLSAITRYDEAGRFSLPPTTFAYLTDTSKEWADPIGDVPFHFLTRHCNDGYTFESQGAVIADINRDGLPDLLRGRGTTCGGGGSVREVYINSGGRWALDTSYTLPADFVVHRCGGSEFDNGLRVVDINGDGLEDLVRSVLTGTQPCSTPGRWDLPVVTVWINNGHGWTQAPDGAWSVPAAFTLYDPACADNGRDLGVRMGDVNGDGLVDLVRRRDYEGDPGSSAAVFLNNGSGWTLKSGWNVPVAFADRMHAMDFDPGGRLADLNGDGLADLVTSRNRNGVFSQAVYFGRGASDGTTNMTNVWSEVTDPEWAFPEAMVQIDNTATETSSFDMGIRFADINGDGRVDIVRGFNQEQSGGSPNLLRKVYLRRAGKGWAEDTTWSARIPYTFIRKVYGGGDYDEGTRIADLDGNGTADFVRSMNDWDCANTLWQDRALNRDGFSDLMVSSANSIGGSSTIDYQPSTIYANRAIGAPAGAPSNLGHVVPVLASLTTSDGQTGTGHTFTTTYQYKGGFYRYDRREFRGFAYVRQNSPGGEAYVETLLVQDPALPIAPLAGAVERQTLRRTSDGAVFTLKVNTFDRDDQLAPYFHWIRRTDDYLYDWRVNDTIESLGATGAVKRTAVATSYTFDGSGFVASREHQTLGNAGITSDDIFTTTELINDTGRWWIGLPKRTYVTDAPGGAGTRISDTWTYYDDQPLNQVGDKGNVTKVERWSDDGPDAPGSASNRVVTLQYDTYGHVTQTRDEEGHERFLDYGINDPTFSFVDRTRVTTRRDLTDVQHQASYLHDARFGVIRQVTATGSGTVSNAYDSFGRITKSWTSRDSADLPTACYQYYPGLRPALVAQFQREVSGLGEACGTLGMLASSSFYDGLGRKIQSRTETAEPGYQANVVGAITFDAEGRVATASNPHFSTQPVTVYGAPPPGTPATSVIYDPAGRVDSVTPPGISTMRSTYDGWTQADIDPEGKKTETDRDVFGRIVQRRTYALAGGAHTLYATNTLEYDRWGRLRFVIDTAGNRIEYRYNNLGEVTRIIDPDAGEAEPGETARTYYKDGMLKTVTDPMNRTVTYEYDALHRLTRKVRPNLTDVLYRHDEPTGGPDPVGHLTSVEDRDTTIQETFEYDNLGRNVRTRQMIDGTWYEVSEELDALGRTVRLTYPDEPARTTVRYQYGSDGRVGAVLDDLTGQYIASEVGYSVSGNLKHTRYANGIVLDHTYDPNTAWLRTTRAVLSATGVPVADLTFGYTGSGYVNSIQDLVGTGSQTFVLDDLYRLRTATAPASYGALSYSHDALGNLISKGPTTGPMVFNFGNQAHPHRVTSTSTGLSLHYDATGSLTSVQDGLGKGRTYDYNEEGNLRYLRDNAATLKEAWYTYDPSGSRVKRRESEGGVEGTPTIFVSDLFEVSGATHKKYVYLEGRRIAEWRQDGSKYFYVGDHLGSLSVVTDSQGQVVDRIEYKPYGEISVMQFPAASPGFMYSGARRDKMTGLYDFGARFYDPTLARFLSVDPVVSDPLDPRALNPYGYGLGNPISYVDVGGLSAFPAVAGLVFGVIVTAGTGGCAPCGGAAGGAVSGALSAQENGGDPWAGALTGGAIGSVTAWGMDTVGGSASGSAGGTNAGEMAPYRSIGALSSQSERLVEQIVVNASAPKVATSTFVSAGVGGAVGGALPTLAPSHYVPDQTLPWYTQYSLRAGNVNQVTVFDDAPGLEHSDGLAFMLAGGLTGVIGKATLSGVLGGFGRGFLGLAAESQAARAATGLARVELNISKHAAQRMAERGITESMVRTALGKGTPFIDPKNGTINYVLKGGFASGKDLLVAKNPLTGQISTVIRGTDLVSPRFVPYQP